MTVLLALSIAILCPPRLQGVAKGCLTGDGPPGQHDTHNVLIQLSDPLSSLSFQSLGALDPRPILVKNGLAVYAIPKHRWRDHLQKAMDLRQYFRKGTSSLPEQWCAEPSTPRPIEVAILNKQVGSGMFSDCLPIGFQSCVMREIQRDEWKGYRLQKVLVHFRPVLLPSEVPSVGIEATVTLAAMAGKGERSFSLIWSAYKAWTIRGDQMLSRFTVIDDRKQDHDLGMAPVAVNLGDTSNRHFVYIGSVHPRDANKVEEALARAGLVAIIEGSIDYSIRVHPDLASRAKTILQHNAKHLGASLKLK